MTSDDDKRVDRTMLLMLTALDVLILAAMFALWCSITSAGVFA